MTRKVLKFAVNVIIQRSIIALFALMRRIFRALNKSYILVALRFRSRTTEIHNARSKSKSSEALMVVGPGLSLVKNVYPICWKVKNPPREGKNFDNYPLEV